MTNLANSTLLVFFITMFCILMVKSCNPIDKEALLDFKLRITDDPSALLESWSPATDCCTAWQGVTCDNGRVVNVSRSGIVYDSDEDDMVIDMSIFMSGTLSPFLGNLTDLQVLDFRALHKLTGPIPPELGKLSNLTHLHLYMNQLSGSIPSSFFQFPKLKLLSLSDNNLTGIIPEFYFQTSTLMVELDLSRNQLSGPLPSSIGKLTSLTTLRLSNNHLSGVIPTSIGDLASLLSLMLCDNQLTGVLPDSIGNLPKIETINLANNMITGNLPSSLGNLSTIQFLTLSNNRFIGLIPSSLGNLEYLETLELVRNQLVGPIPPNLDKLTALCLSYNPLKLGGIPHWLLKFKNLMRLELASTGIKGELTMLPLSLNYLDLSSNELTGKLPSWIGNMHDLVKLDLSNNGFNSTIPEELGNLKYLYWMSLSSNSLHGSIPEKLLNLTYWEVFDVSKNRLTGKIPPHKHDLPISGFMGNPGLCDAPLPSCVAERRKVLHGITTDDIIRNRSGVEFCLNTDKFYEVSDLRLFGQTSELCCAARMAKKRRDGFRRNNSISKQNLKNSTSKNMVDFFSNVPDIVIDTILEKLPIRMAAQTSVLSKQWRQAWLSLQRLIFDFDFQEQQKNKDGSCDWRKNSRIISSILLHHRGHVREFFLYVPYGADEDHMNLSQWISFLSQNGIKAVLIMNNWDCKVFITPYIFRCSDLVYLGLSDFSLNPPPSCFHGFPKLTYLSLVNIKFSRPNVFLSLIKNCKMLAKLTLDTWSGMDHVVIDSPCLQTLIIIGEFESLAFRNVRSLKSISLCLKTMPKKVLTVETVDAINHLASSCQLQSIHFEGYLCQLLAAGGAVRSPPVTFNHLNELRLSNLNLSEFDVFRYLLSMIECCPYIKKLDISVIPGEKVGLQIFDLNYKYKLDRLRVVNIEGMTGSSAELKLVEYVLAISASLENLLFKFGKCDADSERKMSRALMRFPRASPKASLVCLDT